MRKLFLLLIALVLCLVSVSYAQSLDLDLVNKKVFNGNFVYELTDNGLVSVSHKSSHLFNLGVALYGEAFEPVYLKSWSDDSWSWVVLTRNSNEITVEGTSVYLGFEWKQTWSFFSFKDLKIIHTLTNNTGLAINNMELYYVLDVDTNKNLNIFYELNGENKRVNFNSDLIFNQSLNGTEGKIKFDLPGEPVFDFSDLFSALEVNYLFVGNLSNAHASLSSTKGLIVGLTKGSGTMLDGQMVVLDPSISEGVWSSIDLWTGANGSAWSSSIWEDLYTTGTTANTIQSNQGQLRVTKAGDDGRSNFVVKDVHKIILNNIGDIGYYEIQHKSTAASGTSKSNARLGIVNSSIKANNAQFLTFVETGTVYTKGVYVGAVLINSTQDPTGKPLAFKLEKISATDINVNVWIDGIKVMDNNTFGVGTDTDFFFKVFTGTGDAAIGEYTTLVVDDLNIGIKSLDLNVLVPVSDSIINPNSDVNVAFTVFSTVPATSLLFDINYGVGSDVNISILDDGNVASTDSLFCDSNILNPVQNCYFLWNTSSPLIQGDFRLKVLVDNVAESLQDSETTNVFTLSTEKSLKLRFRDENTNVVINPSVLNISINDGDVNSWSSLVVNGQVDINLSNYNSGKWIVTYSDSSHPLRTFIYNINNQVSNSFVLGMLQDTNGSSVDFKFYSQAGISILADANIEVRDSNNHITERKTTNLLGEITFFLNPTNSEYSFNINDVNGSDYNYSLTVVTIKQPLNEIDLTSAGNFRIRTSGITALDLNNLSADTNIFLLSNLVDFHVVKVSNVDANYFDRYYYLKFLGETGSYELQPYLLTAADGSLSNFVALERFTQTTIPGVLLTLRKLIAGKSSPVVVESVETDSVGNALFVAKFNDQYILDISYGSLFESKNIVPILSSHEVVIDLGQVVDFNVKASATLVSWSPETFLKESGGFFNIIVDVNSGSVNIVQIDFNVFNDDTKVVTDVFVGSAVSNYSFNKSFTLVDESKQTEMLVVVYYSNGQKAYFFKSYNVDSGSSWLWVTGLTDFWSDLGQPGTLFIVTLLAVVLTGLIGRHLEFNREYAFGFAATIMGFFCLLGAIQWLMWISVSVFGLFLLILRRKLDV